MQFVPNGPDIPDALLQAHEEGNVVFFCGAGISYPAGLPGFGGLVKDIYRLNGTVFDDIEERAFKQEKYDATLDLLERRLPGQRLAVRRALAQALKPKLRKKGATDTQAALLRLARSREGTLRLVTTNFDRVFHVAAKRTKQNFQAYTAPMLPIPKNSRWDGLVFLHGMLSERADDTALNRLVVTSGDFGLAYLTERWAARFVSELFRNYVVCFVGYSINDPVLRYMMDALAADRMLGEVTPQAWALGDYSVGQEIGKTNEWKAKGVMPILYEVPIGTYDHSALHSTLHAWAETYRDGVLGKERIVVNHALARPSASTRQDDFVGRMLWALSDKSGLPAKRFAEFNPVPPLDWLADAFSDERFQHEDLSRFGVAPNKDVDKDLRFGLVRRPAPYSRAPPMLLVSAGVTSSQWDDVMFHLAKWLLRHMDDPRLIIWIAQRGGLLHERWPWIIENHLDHLASLERDGRTAEIKEIKSQSPKAIPGQLMRTLWSFLLTGRVRTSCRNHDVFRWKDRLKREGLTASVRLELRDLLAPKVALSESFRSSDDQENGVDETRIRQLVACDVVLTTNHARSLVSELSDEHWLSALPDLIGDTQQLLRDALDIMQELREADQFDDRSHWDMPSISPHWQNRRYRDWVLLIEILRDSWLKILENDQPRATRIALAWYEQPYSTFKRLAFFAASRDVSILPEKWVEWLLADDAYWLWSSGARREVLRLFVLQGGRLSGASKSILEEAILSGPPRNLYPSDIDESLWRSISFRSILLRLAKLNSSGIDLGKVARARLAELNAACPDFELAQNESDEFSHWMSGTGDPDFEESRKIDHAPHRREDLVEWLSTPRPDMRPDYEDTWRQVCMKHPLNCLYALSDIAAIGQWPSGRWSDALYSWGRRKKIGRIWRYAAPVVVSMPDEVIKEIVHAISDWLEAMAKSITQHQDILLDLCRRVLALPLTASTGVTVNDQPIDEPVTEAINHPVGKIAQAIMNLWFSGKPNDGDLLPDDIKVFFTLLCDPSIDHFRHGRVLLASRLIALFRVDRAWTELHLLPLLDWNVSTEARSLWAGFLWSPRLYPPLLVAFKSQFLDSANHYDMLGEEKRQYSAFLTYAALSGIDGYIVEDFRSALGVLPPDGLEESAQALCQALEGAAEQREDYWANRVLPFWQYVWPKSISFATPRISEMLARLAIAARSEFPAALDAVQNWLRATENSDYIVHLLYNSGLCRRFPEHALRLLNLMVSDGKWAPMSLEKCLVDIVNSLPALARDSRFLRLRDLSRR